jgi:hypothetical protein
MYKKNEYDVFIEGILLKDKFLVSGNICDLLSKKYGVTNDNARKILERSSKKGVVKTSYPITFGKGQYVYFLPDEKLNKETIKKISKKFRPPLYRLLECLDNNEGIISFFEALKITSSPLERGSSKIDLLEDLIEVLKSRELIYLATDNNNVKYIIYQNLKENEVNLMNYHYSKLKLDAVFVKDILDWLEKSNLILSLNNQYRNKNNPTLGARHNNLLWDAFGYTKTTGLIQKSNSKDNTIEKQTLVVLDVVLSRNYEDYDLDGFLSRIQINLNSVNKGFRKVIPIVVYKNCSSYVYNKMKKLGFLCYNIGSIFGTNIFTILENVTKLQFNHNFINNDDFEKTIIDTLNTIKDSGQEDQLKALKGILFEVILFQVLRHQYNNAEIIPNYYYSKAIINKETTLEESKGYEYDYIIRSSNPKEIIVVELKGYHSNYKIPLGTYETKNTIKWFFSNTLTFIKDKFQKEIDEGYIFKGAYITSSNFEEDAIEFMEKLNNGKLKPERLNVYYDRTKLMELLNKNDFKSLVDIIEKFY